MAALNMSECVNPSICIGLILAVVTLWNEFGCGGDDVDEEDVGAIEVVVGDP